MVLFAIQLVHVVITSLIAVNSDPAENLFDGWQIVIPMHQMLNVITRPVHIYFCFTDNTYLLGHRTNSNFSTGLNETVLR